MISESTLSHYTTALIKDAFKKRASDIHLEPFEDHFRIRFRIDGILYPIQSPPPHLKENLLSHLKVMAHLDIAEKRLPQEGQMDFGEKGYSLRLCTIPTVHGESMVIRLLNPSGDLLTCEQLGFSSRDLLVFTQLIHSKDGLLLITGPTGSGKTTTLYAILQHLCLHSQKIITIEDPVECELPGINQVQVQADMTFASGLRAILRQAPDTLMIGEIRDSETAKIAINAALTGHLVLASLHTHDAIGAIPRLFHFGIPLPLIAGALRGVVAQKLVPRTDKGRMGLFEIFQMSDSLQQSLHDGVPLFQFREEALREDKLHLMEADGQDKILQGLIIRNFS